jgi:hypothetical protein
MPDGDRFWADVTLLAQLEASCLLIWPWAAEHDLERGPIM